MMNNSRPFRLPRRGITFTALCRGGIIVNEPLFDRSGAHSADVLDREILLLGVKSAYKSVTTSASDNEALRYGSNKSVSNGWNYWHVVRDGKLVRLSDIKEATYIAIEKHVQSVTLNLF
jgi:hypothetical protein